MRAEAGKFHEGRGSLKHKGRKKWLREFIGLRMA